MARIIYNDNKYLAAVNRAGYERDVRKFERKLRMWNLFHMTMRMFAYAGGCSLMLFLTAIDDIEHEKLVFTCIALSCLVLSIAILLQKVPRPKLPFGIRIHNGRYIIAGFTHPGEDIVEVNADYVYEDGRKCRVVPCNLKPHRMRSSLI